MSALIFIDTNIYLDFYRARGEASLSILKRLDNNHDRIITTAQVEMEYKKNRQKAILLAREEIKSKAQGVLEVPAFLRESQYNRAIKRTQKTLSEQTDRIIERTVKLLRSPGLYDPVYKILQRLFKAREGCHLTRGKGIRLEIRDLAKKRFMLGYPPRKGSDLSIGDAINWEWIIYCAKQCSDSIVIVSRDSDFGRSYKKEAFLDDWLLQEFKERVGHRRSITLTTHLTEAFKLAAISVSEEEAKSEDQLIEDVVEKRLRSISESVLWKSEERLKNIVDRLLEKV